MIKIFTVGKMNGLSIDEQMNWRRELEKKIVDRTTEYIKFIHPPLFYNYDNPSHKSEKEVMYWNLGHLKDCDIVVVNLKGIADSIETHYELATINATSSLVNKYIYVIGFGVPSTQIHPWIELSLHRREDTLNDAVNYICNYFLE